MVKITYIHELLWQLILLDKNYVGKNVIVAQVFLENLDDCLSK